MCIRDSHMDEPQPFRCSWDWLAPSGLSVKDFIAPSAFEFKTGSSFGVGSKTGCVSFLQILAPELHDRMLADFLDMESSLIVSMHVRSVDQVKACLLYTSSGALRPSAVAASTSAALKVSRSSTWLSISRAMASSARFRTSRSTPVSYTHLDVYKRQSQKMVLSSSSSVACPALVLMACTALVSMAK